METGQKPARSELATAVRYLLEELALAHPGNAIEVRIPPFGVVQCGQGPGHTRGTPPNVVEMGPEAWVNLAVGAVSWDATTQLSGVSASGTRADLGTLVPLGKFAGSSETMEA